MAVSVDSVYQKVLTLCNKEQRGYITPQDFNLFADKAQKEIVRHYFHDVKTGFWKKKSETEALDDLEIAQEKLAVFRRQVNKTASIILGTNGRATVVFALPTDYFKIATIYLNKETRSEVQRVDKNDLIQMEMNPLTKPTVSRPVYCHSQTPGYYEIYPMMKYEGPTTITTTAGDSIYAYSPVNGAVGINGTYYPLDFDGVTVDMVSGDDILIDYWKKPSKPVWGYVVVNEKPLYNSNTSTDFEVHPIEEETLVTRILELSGITIEKPQVTKLGMVSAERTKKEQND